LAALADRSRSDRERLTALKYVVHFIPEVHMPLHAAGRRLGRVEVTFQGRTDKLHKVWDTRILQQHGVDAHALADEIVRNGGSRNTGGGPPAAWAAESRVLARRAIRPTSRQARASHAPLPLSDEYGRENYPIIVEQLRKASVRLAGGLNGALR
jgi:hypothetical protein